MSDKEIIIHFLKRFTEFPAVKLTAGIFLWVAKLLFGPVFRPVYAAVICLWLCDTITGYYYARTNPDLKPESRKMYHGLVKLAIYLFLLLLGYQCSLVEITQFIQTIIESFVILTESYSILENLDKIAKLKNVDIPFLNRLISIIQGKLNETVIGEDESINQKKYRQGAPVNRN